MSNFMPYFTGRVITYPCWDWSESMFVKGAPSHCVGEPEDYLKPPFYQHGLTLIIPAWTRNISSKVISDVNTYPCFFMKISSWNFVCVPKAMLWAHEQSFSLKLVIQMDTNCSWNFKDSCLNVSWVQIWRVYPSLSTGFFENQDGGRRPSKF